MAKGSIPSLNINFDEKEKNTKKKSVTLGAKPNRKDYPEGARGTAKYNRAVASWTRKNKPAAKPKSWQKTPQKTFNRYTERLKRLRQIKNPNDFQKNQIKNAQAIIAEAKSKGAKRITPLDPTDFGDALKISSQMKKNEADRRRQEELLEKSRSNEVAQVSQGGSKTITLKGSNNKRSEIKTLEKRNDSQDVKEKTDGVLPKNGDKKEPPKEEEPKHWIRTPLEQEMGTKYKDSDAARRDKRRKSRLAKEVAATRKKDEDKDKKKSVYVS